MNWRRLLATFSILLATQWFGYGCSSSSAGQEGQGDEVAASEDGNQAAEEGNQAAEEGNQTAEEGNQAAEGNQVAEEGNQAIDNTQGNIAEQGNNNDLGANNQAGGLNDQGNALVQNDQAQQGGEEDLQQIIEEMNTANGQLPANTDPAANAGNSVVVADPVANSAVEANFPTEAAVAQAVPAPVSGEVMGMAAGAGLPELGSKMSYIVQKGDTLAKIAARIYGDMNRWTEIANFTGLANPRLIYPGDVVYYQLTEQSMKFASSYETVKRSEVQIQQGDTLASIAGRVLGNPSLWKLIWRENDSIANPDRLTAGSTIFYVNPSQMASLNQTQKEEMVSVGAKAEVHKNIVSDSQDSAGSTIYEVANDHLSDLFSQGSLQETLTRT